MGLLKRLLTLSLTLFATRAAATVTALPTRAVMEGIKASNTAILVDTVTPRVDVGTNSYNGSVFSPVLYTTGNVVISNTNADSVVIYATGTLHAKSLEGSGLGITAVTAGSLVNGPLASSIFPSTSVFTSSGRINNITDPVSAQDVATKNYVDSNVLNLDYKTPVRLGTTAALPANVYSNGSSGVGATITGSGLGLLTVDSATPLVGDRVMVNNETLPSHNGLYVVTVNAVGSFFILTRTTDFNTSVEMTTGTLVAVTSGTVNASGGADPSTWLMTTAVNTIGTDPVSFIQTSGLGEVVAGSGITIVGSTISTSGQTTTCLTGQSLNNATYTKGVASGGTCTAVGVGDVVQRSINTFFSSNTFVAGSTITILGTANTFIMFSSADIVGSTFTPTMYFSGVNTSSRACAVYSVSQTTQTNVYPVFIFNGAVAAAYTYSVAQFDTGGGHPGAGFTNSVAAPMYQHHYGATAQNITINKRWRTWIYFETAELPTSTDFNFQTFADTAWMPGTKVEHRGSGQYAGGPPTSLSFAMSSTNAIDTTGAVDGSKAFSGMHLEFWCQSVPHP